MTHSNPCQKLNAREIQNLLYTKPMTLLLPEQLEKRLEAIATERHVPVDTLVAQALEEFLAQQLQPQRRNSKGFIVPSFVGRVASEDSTWIDQHEEFLWNNDGRRTLCC
jgi:predicted transcriptional regulator